jgi:hypothetical protein
MKARRLRMAAKKHSLLYQWEQEMIDAFHDWL